MPTQYSACRFWRGPNRPICQCSGCITRLSPHATGCAGSVRTRPGRPSKCSSCCSHFVIAAGDFGAGSGNAICICSTCGSPVGIFSGGARWLSSTPVTPNSSPSTAPQSPTQPCTLRSHLMKVARRERWRRAASSASLRGRAAGCSTVTPAMGLPACGGAIVSGAFTRECPFVQSNGRRTENMRRPGNMKMRMDIITQMARPLNPPAHVGPTGQSGDNRRSARIARRSRSIKEKCR
ncbi:hypothetical protein BDI4_790034 [Burkholderia diffusa]|nr:hypothetical protein BDI4_790034 [Burkholderia diffusa]